MSVDGMRVSLKEEYVCVLGAITRFNAIQNCRLTSSTANRTKNWDLIVCQPLRTAVYLIAQQTVINP